MPALWLFIEESKGWILIQLTHLEERNSAFRKTCLVFILLAALGSAWAQNEIIQDSETVAGRTYLKSEDKWYSSENGTLQEEVFIDTLIVGRDDQLPLTDYDMAPYGASVKEQLHPGYAIVKINPDTDSFSALAEMTMDGFTAAFDRAITFFSEPNDLYYTPSGLYVGQWPLTRIGMPAAWNLTKGSSNIVVAISDSGVQYSHPDLSGNVWTNLQEIANNGIDDDHNGHIDDRIGWDFENNDNDPDPMNWNGGNTHGTSVAGIIASRSNNGIGVASVAGGWGDQKGVSYMPLRISQELSTAMASVLYAVQAGAHVVNMSWGADHPDSVAILRDLFDYLNENYDCVFIAAAGNLEFEKIQYPAAFPETIAVGSSNNLDHYTQDSYGPELDLVAPVSSVTPDLRREPGTPPETLRSHWNQVNGIFSLDYNPLFGETSGAAPLVSGSAGLMLSLNVGLSPVQIQKTLLDSAEKVWPGTYDYNWNPEVPGHSLHMGYGRLRCDEALRIANQLPSINLQEHPIRSYYANGDPVVIRWDRRGYTGPVRLRLYNSLVPVLDIASSLTTSEFTWRNPGNLTTARDYRIKIEANTTMYDYNDRPFGLEGVTEVQIPDSNLLSALRTAGVDRNLDHRIDRNEAAQVTSLNLAGKKIADLRGIEWFTNLTTLNCANNKITDMSPVFENQAFMARCDKSIDFSNNWLDVDSEVGVCELACSSWLSFKAANQRAAFNCLCWDLPCEAE